MRVFTKQEKWILKKTASIKVEKNMHSISLGDICSAFLEHEYINVNYHSTNKFYSLDFRFSGDNYSNLRSVIRRIFVRHIFFSLCRVGSKVPALHIQK